MSAISEFSSLRVSRSSLLRSSLLSFLTEPVLSAQISSSSLNLAGFSPAEMYSTRRSSDSLSSWTRCSFSAL